MTTFSSFGYETYQLLRHWPPGLGEAPEYLLSGAQPAADGNVHDLVEAQGAHLTHLDRMGPPACRDLRGSHQVHLQQVAVPKGKGAPSPSLTKR
jgi:predicted oxidoreductase